REALRLFGAAWAIADRLDAKGHLADVVPFEAPVLLTLGRWKDAMELDERGDILSRQAKPCQRAQFLSNWGDQAILAKESREEEEGAADIPDPLPKLREALSIYQGPCNQPGAKAAVLTNLA